MSRRCPPGGPSRASAKARPSIKQTFAPPRSNTWGAATLLAELALAPALLCVRRSEGGLPFLWCVCCDDRIGRRDLLRRVHLDAGKHLLSRIDCEGYVIDRVEKQ